MEHAFVLELSDSKFKDLFVCFCGYAQCEPLHAFGPAVRPNYILHYIIDGKGFYQTGNHKFFLEAGASCDYQNTLVFSKAFKRNMGCTP